MAHRGPPYRTCDLFDQVHVSYCVDAIFPAQCAVQIISVLQYWYNKLTDQGALSGSAEAHERKVGVRSHTVLRSFMSNSVSPWFQSCNNKPPVKKKLCLPCSLYQGSQIRQIWHILRQNCPDDSTEVTEGVTLTQKIFVNKRGATSTPEIFGNKNSFVLTFFVTNTICVNCKRCKP